MATALDLIKRSMRMLGVYSIGEDPSPDESQDCLAALQSLMGSMANSPQLIYAKTLDTIALAATVASITVGPTGGTVTTRPVEVLGESYVVLSGVSYPLSVLTLQQYNDVTVKASQGIPAGIWPQMDMPNITLTFWPVPSQAMTLNLWSNKQVTTFPTLTTVVTLPPGYEEMLVYLLAEAMAPEFTVPVPAAVAMGAARARRVLKRTNLQVPTLALPSIMLGGGYADYRDGA